jgi:hypothetical protein
MTYVYQWFGAMTWGAFMYGCMLGAMAPPKLHPARISLLTGHPIPDDCPSETRSTPNDEPQVSVLHLVPTPEPETRRILPLAA